MRDGWQPAAATTVDGGGEELAVMWGGFPLAGAGAGWALVAAADWVTGLRWAPWQGLFELLARQPPRPAAAVAAAIGLAAGLLLAGVGTRERLIVAVDREQVRLRRDGAERSVPRRPVSAVFCDRKHLVVLGSAGEELARERGDLSRERLRDAFAGHGWPWQDVDPHDAAYRRWVEGLPGLPAGADALLRARQRAVDRDRRRDARELRTELARLGVVVRDQDRRQYWRTVTLPLRREEFSDGQ
ncbi:hypothetical protein QTQ03_18800 [Micromonospora sp. WMMA1363]|uniref:YqeB family protein n=1 Tax=Micromonospora sp. WMMA1363 TaxID=3053985 RepID=UPI00259CC392|nr:hypothetical protein [Micromonospora sp. WMMA1363]MDM4721541.1 hypothetical protein [Micromonospora sp. WMMA1363]